MRNVCCLILLLFIASCGKDGKNGLMGLPGMNGFDGERGIKGEQGIQGDKGLKGDPGIASIVNIYSYMGTMMGSSVVVADRYCTKTGTNAMGGGCSFIKGGGSNAILIQSKPIDNNTGWRCIYDSFDTYTYSVYVYVFCIEFISN